MTKKALDEKCSYQIDEHNVVHFFRGEEECQQLLTNPLLSAIFKIEELEKEITELKGEADNVLDNWCKGDDPCPHLKKRDDQLIKAKKIIKYLLLDVSEKSVKRIAELEQQIEKMKCCLEKWYNQHSDKGYTETFYQNLLRETESFLWTDVCVK